MKEPMMKLGCVLKNQVVTTVESEEKYCLSAEDLVSMFNTEIRNNESMQDLDPNYTLVVELHPQPLLKTIHHASGFEVEDRDPNTGRIAHVVYNLAILDLSKKGKKRVQIVPSMAHYTAEFISDSIASIFFDNVMDETKDRDSECKETYFDLIKDYVHSRKDSKEKPPAQISILFVVDEGKSFPLIDHSYCVEECIGAALEIGREFKYKLPSGYTELAMHQVGIRTEVLRIVSLDTMEKVKIVMKKDKKKKK